MVGRSHLFFLFASFVSFFRDGAVSHFLSPRNNSFFGTVGMTVFFFPTWKSGGLSLSHRFRVVDVSFCDLLSLQFCFSI